MMTKKGKIEESIKKVFKKTVNKDKELKESQLLVDTSKLDIHMNLVVNSKGKIEEVLQPNYIASVGKIFTSVLISILKEKNKIEFNDKIVKYLEEEITDKLHVYKGKDFSEEIIISQLLNHTSGLNDHFYPLLEKIIEDKNYRTSPKEVIEWSKNNLSPVSKPGEKFNYSDTNYHLLGLIIENITGLSLANAFKKYIFKPLGMKKTSMLHYSKPIDTYEIPIANFYYKDKKLNDYKGYADIDYAGGGIVSTSTDLLIFMKALINHEIIREDTLEKMGDWQKQSLGLYYGYGIMRFKKIPLLMPYNFWGHSGATGSFMYYQPDTEAFIIGNFNNFKYEKKSVRFIVKVISKLSKLI